MGSRFGGIDYLKFFFSKMNMHQPAQLSTCVSLHAVARSACARATLLSLSPPKQARRRNSKLPLHSPLPDGPDYKRSERGGRDKIPYSASARRTKRAFRQVRRRPRSVRPANSAPGRECAVGVMSGYLPDLDERQRIALEQVSLSRAILFRGEIFRPRSILLRA